MIFSQPKYTEGRQGPLLRILSVANSTTKQFRGKSYTYVGMKEYLQKRVTRDVTSNFLIHSQTGTKLEGQPRGRWYTYRLKVLVKLRMWGLKPP